jgi:hypothetical protein
VFRVQDGRSLSKDGVAVQSAQLVASCREYDSSDILIPRVWNAEVLSPRIYVCLRTFARVPRVWYLTCDHHRRCRSFHISTVPNISICRTFTLVSEHLCASNSRKTTKLSENTQSWSQIPRISILAGVSYVQSSEFGKNNKSANGPP